MDNLKPAIWLARQRPTTAQIEEIEALGFQLVASDSANHLGTIAIKNDTDVQVILQGILAHDIQGVFGTAPVPIQSKLYNPKSRAPENDEDIAFYSSWYRHNRNHGRTDDSKYEHISFELVGFLSNETTLLV